MNSTKSQGKQQQFSNLYDRARFSLMVKNYNLPFQKEG